MLMTHFPIKKIIAAFLPVCFLWLFAACVLSCSDDGAETQQYYSVSVETPDATASDSCPIADAPDATIPERAIFDLQILPVVRYLTFPAESSSFVVARITRRGKPPFTDPPLKRLPVLRI